MNEFLKNQLENNYIVLIYLLALRDKRYDLAFKMLGGQNDDTYKVWRNIKNWYFKALGAKGMQDMYVVLNPDGKVCKNHHFISIAMALNLPAEFVRKKSSPKPIENTDINWLKRIFNKEEVNLILKEKDIWKKTIKG